MQLVSNAAQRPRLGIDLGTLCTAAVLVPSSESGFEIPSVVAISEDRLVAGTAAEQIMQSHPDQGAREVKRRFGDTTPVVLNGETFDPSLLTTELVRAVVESSGVDAATTTLTLTHPASWREYKIGLLRDVASSNGFTDVELISEPVAAARRYEASGRIHQGDTVAVYDLGGTCDATIITLSAAGPTVVGTPQSLERFGGNEIDQVVFDHVVTALGGTLQQLDRSDPAVRAGVLQLRSACTAAKLRLSVESETSVEVAVPGLTTQVRITRDEFESGLRPSVTESLHVLDRAIAAANLVPTDLVGIILSGGGSRIPLVAETVAGHLGRPLLNDFDPKLVVAAGAASMAAASRSVSIADTTSAHHRETIMSDQQNPPSSDTPPAPASGRSTPPPPPAAAKGGPSKAAKLVGGAAVAAAAVAAGVIYGDQIAEAAGVGDDEAGLASAGAGAAAAAAGTDNETGDRFQTADHAERDAEDSMDAFDEAGGPDASAPVPEPVAGPVGTPLAAEAPQAQESFAPRQTQRAEGERQSAPQRQEQARQEPQRQEPQRQEEARQAAPSQAADAPGAPAPRQQPTTSDSPASVIEANPATPVAPVASAQSAAPIAPSGSPEFEDARATLLERLEDFEAPAGTSPEDAQQLRQELIDAVERFETTPGQSTQDALAALRDDYDQRVQDFTQDQKIDALVREAQRDNEAEPATTPEVIAPVLEPEPEPEPEPVANAEAGDAAPADTALAESVVAEPPVIADDADETFVLAEQPLLTAELVDLAVIDIESAVEPTGILIGLDQPAEHGLKDDFDMLIAEPGSGPTDIDFPAGKSLDVKVDTDGELPVVTDVRATYVPPAEPPLLIVDHTVDVLGDASVATLFEQTQIAAVELAEPIVIDGSAATVAQMIETEQVIDVVDIVGGPIIEIEPIGPPVDDFVQAEVDFAADIASDITPAAPDALSFEP